MSSPIRSAVNIAKAALAAVDWVAECSEPVEISSSPERAFEQKDIEEKCVVHVSGGPVTRSFVNRQVTLIRRPQIILSVCRYIAQDDAGLVDEDLLARCESVLDKACTVVCEAIRDSGSYALLSPIEQPEEYQPDLLKKGTYLSAVILNLQLGGGA